MELATKSRRKRIQIGGDIEVLIASNTENILFYESPRIQSVINMESSGDEDYITVKELRSMVNASRSLFEDFDILIVEVLDDKVELEDLLVFLGLDKKYEEYLTISNGDVANKKGIFEFIEKSTVERFEKTLMALSPSLKRKLIESSVKMMKANKLTDYNKMQIIARETNEDLLTDIKDSEFNPE